MTSYTLQTPVTFNGTTYRELTFRKPRTGDMMVMDMVKGEVSKTVALMATIADVPLPAFKLIELDDFTALSEVVAPLLGESKPSTENGEI